MAELVLEVRDKVGPALQLEDVMLRDVYTVSKTSFYGVSEMKDRGFL